MTRILICLPFLLFFALLYPRSSPETEGTQPHEQKAEARARTEWFAALAPAPLAGFPAALPWPGAFQAVNTQPFESLPLPERDIITFMEKCIEKYEREVKGYKAVLSKHERVNGALLKPEVVRVAFREEPFSVHLQWLEGKGLAEDVLYNRAENEQRMWVKPAGAAGAVLSFFTNVIAKDIHGSEAKASGRYTIDEFGIQKGTIRTITSWKKMRAAGRLHVEYEGVYFVAQAGNRPCYKIHRSKIPSPEDDGVLDVVLYIDTETWLQVGTILRGENGQLIGEYFFRDIELNPTFPPAYFSKETLSKKK